MRKLHLFLAVAFVAVLASITSAATNSTQTVRLQGIGPVLVTAQGATGETVAVTGIDTSESPSKKCIVQRLNVAGNDVYLLLRFEHKNGALWIDVVGDSSVSSLSATVTSLSLSSVTIGHPSPARDLIDTSAIVAAGGS